MSESTEAPFAAGEPTGIRSDVAEAAIAVFREKGYERATVREIAKRAGLGTSSLYFHIGSKEDLFLALVCPVLQVGADWIEEVARSDRPPEEKLRVACIQSAVLYDSQPQIALYLSDYFRTVDSMLPELTERTKRAWCEIVGGVMAKNGAHDPDDAKLVALGILGMFSWMHRWYRAGKSRTSTEIGELYAQLILNGLEPRA